MRVIKESSDICIDLKGIFLMKSEIQEIIGGEIVEIDTEPRGTINDLEVNIRNPRTVPGEGSPREIDLIAGTTDYIYIGYVEIGKGILYIYENPIEHLNRDTLKDAWQDRRNWTTELG